MLDDVLKDEKGPGEPDPEADLTDYEEQLAPSVRIPGSGTPQSTAEGSVPGELQRRFWVLVLAFNAALLAGSLGAMLVVFRGDWTTGGRLLLAGAVCFGYGYYRLRTWDTSASSFDDDDDEGGGDEESTDDDATGEDASNDVADDND
ncbi:DUF7322 domain-containing protein [Haloarchaeobius sp. HRN-SO-5]|uniref:DUF7322 domain-containing protein n=1 Tax=Haloarchaeobius sp. HRN-SO-5 TaxID=3446118 RepID=UPI003EB9B736